MLWLRKGFVGLLSLVLFFCLLGVVGALTFDANFSKPDHIEGWLQQSNLTKNFVSGVISGSKQSTGGQSSDIVDLSNTAVQEAANGSFPADSIQKDINAFLDGNYSWLEGKTATPSFNIDLSKQKEAFAQQVGQYVTAYLKNLPTCTAAQQAAITNPNVDPLSLTCRPSALDPATEGASVTQQLASSDDFLSATNVTPSTIVSDKSGKPYYEKLSKLPTIYKWATKLPLILTGIAAVLMLGIFFIAPTRRAGTRRLGVIFLLAGILLIVEKLVADAVVKNLNANKILNNLDGSASATNGPIQKSLTSFMHIAETALTRFDLYFGLGFLLIGLICTIYIISSRKKGSTGTPASVNPAPEPTADQPVEPALPTQTPATNNQRVSAPPVPRSGGSTLDISRPKPVAAKPVAPRPKPVSGTQQPKLKPRKPPRLIQ